MTILGLVFSTKHKFDEEFAISMAMGTIVLLISNNMCRDSRMILNHN